MTEQKEMPESRQSFNGHSVAHRFIAFGLSGEIPLPKELLAATGEEEVRLELVGKIDSFKYKFEPDGSARELVTLVVQRDSVLVRSVKDAPPKPVQETLDAAEGEPVVLTEEPITRGRSKAADKTPGNVTPLRTADGGEAGGKRPRRGRPKA